MDSTGELSFQDTSIAFSYKTDSELKKANFIFSLVNHPWVSAMATGFTKIALEIGLPIRGIVKKTAFAHFCGGETIEESKAAIEKLRRFNVGTILDYSVEGEKTEAGFDRTLAETLRTIEMAKKTPGMPFCVFKVTGLASFALLEKLHRRDTLSKDEEQAYARAKDRVKRICDAAFNANVPVLIDAEETWIQDPIDLLAYDMMAVYNKSRAIVFNTYQLYRTETLANLKSSFADAAKAGYWLGAKLVRGAYMEKERARAKQHGYPSPIQPTKEASDQAFNDGLLFCLDNINRVAMMCGSHNEYSNMYCTRLMAERQLAKNDARVWFGQLFGMSDNISFNLAKAGYNVAKYVPYGPVESVMPYLLRRAAENTSVAGQSSRELTLIRAELKRRRLAK